MKKSILLIALFSVFNVSAGETSFNFNYKNINSLAMLICNELKPSTTSNSVIVNKFTTYKTKYGATNKELLFELSGVCNSRVSKKTAETLSYGEELQLNIDLKSPHIIEGSVGLSKIKVKLTKTKIASIVINNLIENTKTKIKLPSVRWASNDSLISINENDSILMKNKGRLIASEKEANLYLNTGEVLYSIWNYQAYGCHTTNGISEKKCESYSSDI